MRNVYSTLFILTFFLCSCGGGSSESGSSGHQQKSINGTYTYSDNSAESSVVVSGSTWYGTLVIKTGISDSYDNSNASYSSGIVRDGKLYDDSGYIELGSVNGSSLTIPVGSSRVTHYK